MWVIRRCRIYSEQGHTMSEPKYYLVGPEVGYSGAYVVHEKRGGRVVFVWRGFPIKNSTRMKLYPKGLHYTNPLPDSVPRKPFDISGSELIRERSEDAASKEKVAAGRAAIEKAVAPKKPTPPTPAPGGEYVQTTLFGYKNI